VTPRFTPTELEWSDKGDEISLIVMSAASNTRRRLSGETTPEVEACSDDHNNTFSDISDNSKIESFTSCNSICSDNFGWSTGEDSPGGKFDTLWRKNSVATSLSPKAMRVSRDSESRTLRELTSAARRRIWKSLDSDAIEQGNCSQKKVSSAISSSNYVSRNVTKNKKAMFKKKEIVELLISSVSAGHIWVPVEITNVNMSKRLPYYDCLVKNPGSYRLSSHQFSSVPHKRLRKLTIGEEVVKKNMRVRIGKYKIGDFVEIANTSYATDEGTSRKDDDKMVNQTGIVRYIGKLDGKKGVWYGLELMKGQGRHDGNFNGVQYFNVKSRMGVFVPANLLNRKLSRVSIDKFGIFDSKGDFVLNSDIRIKSRVELRFGGVGVLKYVGGVPTHSGIWYGIELDTPTGRNDGLGMFKCKPNHGIFVRRNRIKTIRSQTMTIGVISTRFARNIEALNMDMNDSSAAKRLEKDIEEAFSIEDTLATEIVNALREFGEVSEVLGKDASERLHARIGEIESHELYIDDWDILKYFLLYGDPRSEFHVEKLIDPLQKEQLQNSKWPHLKQTGWSQKQKELGTIQSWRLRAKQTLDVHLCLKAVVKQNEKMMKQLQKRKSNCHPNNRKTRRRQRSLTVTPRPDDSQRPKINSADVIFLRQLIDKANMLGVKQTTLTRSKGILKAFEAQLELDSICKFYHMNPEAETTQIMSQTIADLDATIMRAKTSCQEMSKGDTSQYNLPGIVDLSEALDLLEFLKVSREVRRATSSGSYEDLLRAKDRAKDLIACTGVFIDLTEVEEKIRYCALLHAIEVGIENGRLKELAVEMIESCQKGLWLSEYTTAVVKMLEDVSFIHSGQYWSLAHLVIPERGSKIAPYFVIARENFRQQEVAIDGVDVVWNQSGLLNKLRSPRSNERRPSFGASLSPSASSRDLWSERNQRGFNEGDGTILRADRHRRSLTQEDCEDTSRFQMPPKQREFCEGQDSRSSSLPTYLKPKTVPFRGSVITRGASRNTRFHARQRQKKTIVKDDRNDTIDQDGQIEDDRLFGRNKRRSSYNVKIYNV